MNESQIKHQRMESRLREVMAEAIASLNDERLSGLTVLDVKVTKGKYDADVYLDGSDFDKNERERLEALLKKSSGFLQRYALASDDWFKIPKLHFKFDDSFSTGSRMDELFDKISKRKES
jgi:ribosome-binding factor A